MFQKVHYLLSKGLLYLLPLTCPTNSQVKFVDPLNEFEGVSKYKSNIKMIKDSPLFQGAKMDLHDAVVQEDSSVITRWTLAMTFKPAPWKPVRVSKRDADYRAWFVSIYAVTPLFAEAQYCWTLETSRCHHLYEITRYR